jgi:hypothetical protein
MLSLWTLKYYHGLIKTFYIKEIQDYSRVKGVLTHIFSNVSVISWQPDSVIGGGHVVPIDINRPATDKLHIKLNRVHYDMSAFYFKD